MTINMRDFANKLLAGPTPTIEHTMRRATDRAVGEMYTLARGAGVHSFGYCLPDGRIVRCYYSGGRSIPLELLEVRLSGINILPTLDPREVQKIREEMFRDATNCTLGWGSDADRRDEDAACRRKERD